MNANDLLAAYTQVAKEYDLPSMELAGVKVESRDILDPEATWVELVDLAPIEGWVQFQSHLMAFTGGSLPAPLEDWGVLLAAEAVDAGGRSIGLRQNGSGGMRLAVSTMVAVGRGPEGEGALLAETVRHLATRRAPDVLCHRRFWRVEAEPGATPVFAAFQGFGPREET